MLCGASFAAPRHLAVLVAKPLRSMEAAAKGARSLTGVQVHLFRLYEGTAVVDRAARQLGRFPFDGVVALGAGAHDFASTRRVRRPYAATLVLGDGTPNPELVPFDAEPAHWGRLVAGTFPTGTRVGALASGQVEAARLQGLAAELEARGYSLVLQPISQRVPLTKAMRRLLSNSDVLFFPRDRGLLTGAVVGTVMREAHRANVPVLAFSRALVGAGALVSLDVPPQAAGARAACQALGLDEAHPRPRVTINADRGESLGVTIPAEYVERSRAP